MFSSQHAHARIEGFSIPTPNAPTPATGPLSSSHTEHHPLFSATSSASYVDPSFIYASHAPAFSSSQRSQYGSSFATSALGGGAGLSDSDLYDDAAYAALLASASPQPQHQQQHAQQRQQQHVQQQQGHQNAHHHSFSSPALGTVPASYDHFYGHHQPPNALQHFLAQSASNNGAIPPRPASAASLPPFSHSSPRDSRSPSAGTDIFGSTPLPAADSPLGNGAEFGSYSSVGESLSASLPNHSGAVPSSGSTKRRASPPDSGSGRTGRASSVGKAPASATRSRSARRSASAHRGSVGNAAQAAAPPPPAHPIAMSMPAYSGGSAGSWFPSSIALSNYGESPRDDSASAASPALTGWKPSDGRGVPSSAPTLGAKSRGKAGLDDVEEESVGSSKHAAAILTEKRRKRRESHNAVERRRRDNINDRITDLASLLPDALLDQVAASDEADEDGFSAGNGLVPTLDGMFAGGGSMTVPGKMKEGVGKPNKGVVLAKSVEYIRYLQQLVQMHQQRSHELESMITALRTHGGHNYDPSRFPPPQAQNVGSPNDTNTGMFSSPDSTSVASPSGAALEDAFLSWGQMRLKSEDGDDDDRMLD